MSIYEAFILLGGVGLFLYGMTIMSTGLKNACGEKLKTWLEKATSNKVTSILAGIVVTVFIQSSSATDVMVIGFVTSGLMSLFQAIGVIMGANIGTTITAQITAFNIGAYAPFILFIGAIVNLFMKNKTVKHIGSVILGFGMLFEGITLMKSAIAPLAETPAFVNFVRNLDHPVITVLFGIAFTALLQSSSSATVIFQAFAVQGIITYHTAVYLIIGAAIGSVTPNLLAGLTANRNGKRCAVLNLLFNLIRAALVLLIITIFPAILTFIQNLSPGNVARQIANTHTIFAIGAVLILAPVSDYIVKLAQALIPKTPAEARQAEEQKLVYLTQDYDKVPTAIVLDQAHREVTRMANIAVRNMDTAMDAFFDPTDEKIDQVYANEATVDFLTHEILAKLVELRSLDMSLRNMDRLYRMIQVVDDIERISDHAENIIGYVGTMKSGEARISEAGMNDLRELSEATLKSLHFSLDVYDKLDSTRIAEAEDYEQAVDDAKERAIRNHVQRLMVDSCDPTGGVIYTDLCTDLERCSDHIINLAQSVLRRSKRAA